MNETSEAPIPPANTQGEVNVHLGYIRRDLLDIKNQNAKDLKEIKEQISTIGDHYVTQLEFTDVKELTVSNKEDIKGLYKIVYIGLGVVAALQFIAPFIITHYWK